MLALSKEQRIARLWELGEHRWKLYPDQRDIYDRVRAFLDDPATQYESFYVDIARQWGKTFMCVLLADEYARRHPGSQIRYVSTTRTALRKLVHPNFRTLLADCPQHLRPVWNGLDHCYRYPNGSEISVTGANNGHADDSRGQRAHLVVLEEAGFVDELEYLVSSVLTPQLTTTGGRVLFISTPPLTPAHDVMKYLTRCQQKGDGNYVLRTIDENKHLTERAKEKLIEECGGRDSPQAQRELWCRKVVDTKRAIVPEFVEHKPAIVKVPEVPSHFYPLEAMDVGFKHLHAIGFGWWDFKRAKLVIWDEEYLRRARTDQIAAAIQAKEAEHFPNAAREVERDHTGMYLHEPFREKRYGVRRWSDVDLRLIEDLNVLHRLPFAPTAKDDLEAQINALRLLVKEHQLEIHPRCVQTIAHLEYGIWNKSRTGFEETEEFGHFDGVAMTVYLLRNAPRHLDPYPPRIYPHDVMVTKTEASATPGAQALASAIFGEEGAA